MRTNNPCAAAALAVAALLAGSPALGEILFREDFETGTDPFGFDEYRPHAAAEGDVATAGPPQGRVWRVVVPAGEARQLVGHRVLVEDAFDDIRQLHWSAYVKFGDRPGTTPWGGNAGESFQLILPLVTDVSGTPLLSGRFLAADRRGRFGTFALTTADGKVHRPIRGKLLVADRWNAIEFSVEDRGGDDRVRVWIDNDDPANPDYEFTGGDMVDAAAWQRGLRFDHGYVAHPAAETVSLSYDAVTIASGFIGLPVKTAVRPTAPRGLQVE